MIGMDPASNPGHPSVGLYSLDGNLDASQIRRLSNEEEEAYGLRNMTWFSSPDNTTMCFVLDQSVNFKLYDADGSGYFGPNGLLGRRVLAKASAAGMIFSRGGGLTFQEHVQSIQGPIG